MIGIRLLTSTGEGIVYFLKEGERITEINAAVRLSGGGHILFIQGTDVLIFF